VEPRLAGLDLASVTAPKEQASQPGGLSAGATGPEMPSLPQLPLPGNLPGLEGGTP